jgi:transcriptional regulator with XRE-family HTH domain
MQLHTQTLNAFAQRLQNERQCQDLSREQLASVCNVSTSFIRDAESNPGRCSLEKLLQLTQGLGLRVAIAGWQNDVDEGQHEAPRPESPAT